MHLRDRSIFTFYYNVRIKLDGERDLPEDQFGTYFVILITKPAISIIYLILQGQPGQKPGFHFIIRMVCIRLSLLPHGLSLMHFPWLFPHLSATTLARYLSSVRIAIDFLPDRFGKLHNIFCKLFLHVSISYFTRGMFILKIFYRLRIRYHTHYRKEILYSL